MQRVTITNRVQSDFAMVPNALWARGDLSFRAKGVAAYLCSLRDGQAMPYVAEIEATLGLGRDARKAAFAELHAVGFLSWRIERQRGRIVAKCLDIDPLAVAGLHRATEKPSDGSTVGRQTVAAGVETRRCSDGVSGDLKRDKKKQGAKSERSAPAKPRRSLRECSGGASHLTKFQRSQIAKGSPLLFEGELMQPSAARYAELVAELQAERVQ